MRPRKYAGGLAENPTLCHRPRTPAHPRQPPRRRRFVSGVPFAIGAEV